MTLKEEHYPDVHLLDLYRDNQWTELTRCPRIDHDHVFWLHKITGEVREVECKAVLCPWCGPRQWQRRAIALYKGGLTGPPTIALTLTMAPDSWPKLRQKMADLPRLIARQGVHGMEMAWTVEPTGRRVPHVHSVVKGIEHTVNSIQTIERVWGHGVCDVPITSFSGVSYLYTNARDYEAMKRHLALNGGRLDHRTRNYLGGMTMKQAMRADEGHDNNWHVVGVR